MAYGVGAALEHERVRRNLLLADIASQTRISTRFLKAIEAEDFEQLPGIVFARNFVRQYALALSLDPDPLLAQLPRVDITDAPLPSVPAREKQRAWDPRWNSAISTVTWLVLAAGAAAAAYIHFNHPAPTRAEKSAKIAQTPARITPPVPPPTPTPASVAAPPAPAHPVEVVVTAKEQSWVQVTADGKIAFTATLEPNETRSVAADDQVKVIAGNAGGVSISLNGKALDPIGPSGQVRTVRLTAAGLQLVQKTPPPQPPPDPL